MRKTFLPIHLIPKGSTVSLYGAGKIGRLYYDENEKLKWCNIICAFDRNYRNIIDFPVEVFSPDDIGDYSFDIILIARISLAGRVEIDGIRKDLSNRGVDPKCIVSDSSCCLWSDTNDGIIDDSESDITDKDFLKIAFLPSGAMGDNIISLKLYTVIAGLAQTGIIDVYSKGDYAEAIFYNQPLLRSVCHNIWEIDDERWREYDLVLRSEFEPVIQYCKVKRIIKMAPQLAESLRKLYQYQIMNNSEMPVGVYTSGIRMNRARFWGLNRYTLLGCNGIFSINDQYVSVFLKEEEKTKFDELDLGNSYITFCYGAGGSPDKRIQQTKVWPKEKYEQWVSMMKREYPNIRLIQLGALGTEHVNGADDYLFGLPIEVIKYVLKNSMLHLDCDSGLSHLATQMGTKCIVLFGPTPAWFLGYDRNVNISSVACGECKDLIADWYFRCLNHDRPICMQTIDAKDVFNKTCEQLVGING